MSLFQQAVKLNNDGVSSILDGNYASGIDSMSQSIVTLKRELQLKRGSATTSTAGNSTNTILRRSIHRTSSSSADDIIFCQAFILSEEREVPKNIDDVNDANSSPLLHLDISVSAVIFNLALSHHLQVPADGGGTCANKAEKLYRMVLGLLDGPLPSTNGTVLLIKLACICNLSQLRFSKGDNIAFGNDGYLSDQVASLLRQTLNKNMMVEEPEILRLSMSILLLKKPCVAAAA